MIVSLISVLVKCTIIIPIQLHNILAWSWSMKHVYGYHIHAWTIWTWYMTNFQKVGHICVVGTTKLCTYIFFVCVHTNSTQMHHYECGIQIWTWNGYEDASQISNNKIILVSILTLVFTTWICKDIKVNREHYLGHYGIFFELHKSIIRAKNNVIY